ncbi:hypothetical protein D3C78_1012270 [compost metagenome]
MLAAPGAAGVQHPGVRAGGAAGLAAVARQPVERAVLHEAAFHRGIQRLGEGQDDGPHRFHDDTGHAGREFGRGGEQHGGLRRRHCDDHLAERAVTLPGGIDQMPVLLAAKHLGDAAGEGRRQLAEQVAGQRAHARYAGVAQLGVRRQVELAALGLVQRGLPLGQPAVFLPLLHDIDEVAVAGGEVLGAQVEVADFATLAGHASAAATALVEELYAKTRRREGVSRRQAGHAAADDGDGSVHDVTSNAETTG